MQSLVRDAAFAILHLGSHGVEAAGQATDLVVALYIDPGVLAALQSMRRLVQLRDRPGHAARQDPATPADHDQPRQTQQANDDQQRTKRRQRLCERVAQQQYRATAGLQGAKRLGQGDLATRCQIRNGRPAADLWGRKQHPRGERDS